MLRIAHLRHRVILPLGRRYASTTDHHHPPEDQPKMEMQPENYRPGSDHYAYENPWPKLNKGRLDGLFQDGYRRPLARDQGGWVRMEWIRWLEYGHDEYRDWYKFHLGAFMMFTMFAGWLIFIFLFMRPDYPELREWARREAYLEIERRQKAGLPLISKDLIDPKRVFPTLPSEEELRDFDIII
ncbi:ESSS subunit of NADH:ubiquinone oxidoreductase (complex i) domain-containing protein [Ditylenchus destructor]|uniref:NADH dehydrogenase [ubiquinone] 1 beta subcomplex subunit 11, mitochondrial n=1 Tax=Ditylenchus destructor TaxID=166010 RepID=A0AAD4R6Q4_9BILA|nr:ESSS subunit of NADH:ubiquinone oxidoreductase (complex i) domain-containing protein [Ditylenchus destructor]